MMEKKITYQGVDIFYREEGQGPTVLLLHGFAEDGSIWKHQAVFLSKQYRVIVPDLPGTGRSANGDYRALASSIDAMADGIYALIQSLALDQPPVVIGHSMGGYITLSLVEKHPNVLRGWGFVHSTAFADSDEKKATRRKAIEFISNNGVDVFLNTSIPNLFAEAYKKAYPQQIEDLICQGRSFSPQALIAYYEAMIARPDRTAVLRNSLQPVLFILGQYDMATPLSDTMKQVHLPKVSHVHILTDVAHMGMWEATDLVNQYLTQYLNSLA